MVATGVEAAEREMEGEAMGRGAGVTAWECAWVGGSGV